MSPEELKRRNLENEFVYSTSRSGGPGGQNVNKVSTKVELRFSVLLSSLFSETEKEIILKKLKNKINNVSELILVSQTERTQLMNKKAVTEKFYDLVSKALTLPVKRRSTRPTLTSKIKRLETKRNRGVVKKLRKDSGGSTEEH
ncbi:MAG: alternative ribosome rescue aminoacyl-tRNA hydrolase ArfB [Bacteroidia bacterium]|nr:alternative ribosome rescue aminoacyl-tRNA hydrolase ArfB [Bacteroidia bacterium]